MTRNLFLHISVMAYLNVPVYSFQGFFYKVNLG